MQKKILLIVLLARALLSYADSAPTNTSNTMNMAEMSTTNMMYMDFGLGIGRVGNWSTSSMAINVMTMGFYYKPGLAVEIGMDMLPNGTYNNNSAMINTFHLAAKGILPLAECFNLYGKLGLGVNAGQGNQTTNSMMMGMDMQSMQMIAPVNVGPYYGAGMQFNLSKRFALYIEDSGVIAIGGANSSGFGSTNITTAGLEIRM